MKKIRFICFSYVLFSLMSCYDEPAIETSADNVSRLIDFPSLQALLPKSASDIKYVCFAGGLQYMEEFIIFSFKDKNEISAWANQQMESGAKKIQITERREAQRRLSPSPNAALSEKWEQLWIPPMEANGYILEAPTTHKYISCDTYIDLTNHKFYIHRSH